MQKFGSILYNIYIYSMSCCRDRLCFTGSDSDEACPLVICQQERMEQGMPQVCIMNLMGRGLKWRLEKVKVEELSRPSESWLNHSREV